MASARALFTVAFLSIFAVSAGRPLHLGPPAAVGGGAAQEVAGAGAVALLHMHMRAAAVAIAPLFVAGPPLRLDMPPGARAGGAEEVLVVPEIPVPVPGAGVPPYDRGFHRSLLFVGGAQEVPATRDLVAVGAAGRPLHLCPPAAVGGGAAKEVSDAVAVEEKGQPLHIAKQAAVGAVAEKPAVIIGIVVVVVIVVLGAIAVVAIWLCVKKRKRAAREPRARAPSSLPRVHQRQQASEELELGRREEVAGAATGESNGCRLCRRPYGLEGDEAPLTLSCGDRFHRRCIRRWVKENLSCPICNSEQIILLGLGATGGAETRYTLSGCEMQTRDDSVVGRSTFAF